MATVLRHLSLLPHGQRMLTSSAAFWFFSARILVFLMGFAEGTAWGYLGYLFGDGVTRWIGAAIAGTTIFIVVWLIDVSLITLDRAHQEHSQTILGKLPNHRASLSRAIVTFSLRIGLVVASLQVSTPYLAQVVFHRDIQRFLDAAAAQAIDAKRAQITASFDEQIARVDRLILDQRAALEREVAGKGLSGMYGMGPAAQTIADGASKLETDKEAIEVQKASDLAKFLQLVGDWRHNRETLASRYNLDLPEQSIMQSRKALDQLRTRPEFQSTELAIQTFLIFIFAGILLLKLFEPSSVRLYLSEILQQEFDRYRVGTFDALLPEGERSTSASYQMPPLRLYEFLTKVWYPTQRIQENDLDWRARVSATQLSIKELDSLRLEISNELDQAAARRNAALRKLEVAVQDMEDLQSAIAQLETDVEVFESRLVEVESQPEREYKDERARLLDRDHRRDAINTWVERLNDANERLERLLARKRVVEARIPRAQAEFDRADQDLTRYQDELAATSARVRSVRERAAGAA